MKDLIDRQTAIDAVDFGITFAKVIDKSTGDVKELFQEGNRSLMEAIERIKNLPTAQPECKRGEWEFYEDRSPVWDIAGEKTWARAYKCSECGFVHTVIEDFGRYSFCPNCGADMREVDDERPD